MPNDTRELTDDELQCGVWVGKKTGNFFKVTKPTRVVQDKRTVDYEKSTGEKFSIEYSRFVSRFRPATDEDLWKTLKKADATKNEDGEGSNLVNIVEPDHRHDIGRIILAPETKSDVLSGLNRVLRKKDMEQVWGLSKIDPRANRAALNFYGPPGTGKTLTAGAVAALLKRKLMVVDYSQIISKYIGDTAKHIKAVFEQAKAEGDCVVFWDEADALVSKRPDLGDTMESNASGILQNRATLLTALDSYDGVIIFATNKFSNYDEAFLRRIAQHIHFDLPDAEMRKQLFKSHLPEKGNVEVDDASLENLALVSTNLSGGDILNAVLNAVNKASSTGEPEHWKLTPNLLTHEINKIKNAKRVHNRL